MVIANNLPAIIDPARLSVRHSGKGYVDCSDDPSVVQKPMGVKGGISVTAYDLFAIIDPKKQNVEGAFYGQINGGEPVMDGFCGNCLRVCSGHDDSRCDDERNRVKDR